MKLTSSGITNESSRALTAETVTLKPVKDKIRNN
jgi:hypothetical protein